MKTKCYHKIDILKRKEERKEEIETKKERGRKKEKQELQSSNPWPLEA